MATHCSVWSREWWSTCTCTTDAWWCMWSWVGPSRWESSTRVWAPCAGWWCARPCAARRPVWAWDWGPAGVACCGASGRRWPLSPRLCLWWQARAASAAWRRRRCCCSQNSMKSFVCEFVCAFVCLVCFACSCSCSIASSSSFTFVYQLRERSLLLRSLVALVQWF